MAKKSTTKAVQQQRTKEDQWRRRVAQTRPNSPTVSGSGTSVVDAPVDGEETVGYTQAEMRQMPGKVTTSAAATRTTVTPAGRASSSTAAATQRRAMAANRSARARMAASPMSIDEEMRYVRSDVRSLIILTAICLAVIIVLAFIIR